MHRRLKTIRTIKSLYVSVAWSAIVVGLPVLGNDPVTIDQRTTWVLSIVGCGLLANLTASNFAPGSGETAGPRVQRIFSAAPLTSIGLSAIGIAIASQAPDPIGPLGLVPAAELAVALNFRPGEWYRLVAIDGALAAGALAAIGFTSL